MRMEEENESDNTEGSLAVMEVDTEVIGKGKLSRNEWF